ncbi:MAG TPA: PD-(D/E)XK nuclease family protein [Nitrospiria bacterium]|nr:PD-(D/E)XK nuclease family protein [Nitrospiria bacterium]
MGKPGYFKRTKNLYNPSSKTPFRLSRSKVERFLQCPRCFYLDRRLGVDQPAGFPFNLNAAVDLLLKKEFDIYRASQTPHPLMKQFGVDAVPFQHSDLDRWRENFVGIQFHHKPSGFLLTGALDDVWINPKKELHVVDYKATAKDGEVGINADWQVTYKKQIEFYQWLLRMNGFDVSRTGYFVYLNGRKDRNTFEGRLDFKAVIIPYEGSDEWIEPVLTAARDCLTGSSIPPVNPECEYCGYRKAASEAVKQPAD